MWCLWLQNPSWWPLHAHLIHTTTLSSDVAFLDPKPSAPQSRLLKRRNFVDCSSLLLLLPTPTMEWHTCRFKHGQLSFFFGLLTWLYFLDTDKVQMESGRRRALVALVQWWDCVPLNSSSSFLCLVIWPFSFRHCGSQRTTSFSDHLHLLLVSPL